MHTPEEAIAELDHATGELGLKAFMFGGPIARPVPGVDPRLGTALARLARPRQHLRLRPGVGEVRRARRVTHVPHRGDGMAGPRVGEQLRVQPHRDVRAAGEAGPLAVPRRRPHALPVAALRVPGGRCGLGGGVVCEPPRATGRSATATRSSTTTRRCSTVSCSSGCSRNSAPIRSGSASTGSTTACGCSACPTRTRRRSTSSRSRASTAPRRSATSSRPRSTSAARRTTR